MVDVKVEVKGVRELSAAFKRVDADLPKHLKARFLVIVGTVAGIVRQKMPRKSGRAAGSVKPRASARGASIAFGGSAAEHEPWLDFGGGVGRNRSIRREFIPGGRYVYPTIAEQSDEIERGAELAIKETARDAGFETRGMG